MMKDFRSARYWASELIEPGLGEGMVCVDATMGNGHDTLWLCGLVGETGRVYGFDVQSEAVERTRARLCEAGLAQRATLFCEGHEHMAERVGEPVDLVMFNLGWLPGAAHGVTTRTETTLLAVEAALSILKPGGLVTICVYPGHDEGARELEALKKWASALDARCYDAMLRCYMNQPNDPPQLIAVKRKLEKQTKVQRI
ncbi:MAG: class I SAM-dependent methyltransferase [Clostridia bacterium]|nr:class I SAM-dependent methyltransferase [Clostridia bacterium]